MSLLVDSEIGETRKIILGGSERKSNQQLGDEGIFDRCAFRMR